MGCKCTTEQDYDINDLPCMDGFYGYGPFLSVIDPCYKDNTFKTDSYRTFNENYVLTVNPIRTKLYNKIVRKFNESGGKYKVEAVTLEEVNEAIKQNPYAHKILNYTLGQAMKGLNPDDWRDVTYSAMRPISVTSSDGSVQYYAGDYNNYGECHGKGIWVKDRAVYAGTFRDDLFDGRGVYIKPNGSYYIGDFKKGKIEGKGKNYKNGYMVYEGTYKNNKKEGYGKERYKDGSVFMGNFSNNDKSGHGTFLMSNGSAYQGHFNDTNFEGEGTYIWPDGNKYIGNFKNGKFEGEGRIFYADGTEFSGTFSNGLKDGEGTFNLGNGEVYSGVWKNDFLHGPGTYSNNGMTKNVEFRFGKLCSEVER